MSEPFIGELRLFPYTFAPRGWAYCEGQVLPIVQYQTLYAVIGTSYGGDGRTTFALPDLRGRTAIGAGYGPGLSPRTLGWTGGSDSVSLTTGTMPGHVHSATPHIDGVALKATTTIATEAAPAAGSVLATGYDDRYKQAVYEYRQNPTGAVALGGGSLLPETPAVENTGGNQAHENRMPSLGLRYCIALEGVFPPRS